jgi:hypothetical protein
MLFGALVAAAWTGPAARASGDEPASSKIWTARASEFETFLKNAKVVRMESVPVGVTAPQRAYLEDGPIRSLTWKPIRPGRYSGYWESYRSEIAAYELDKLLDLQMIPPTVEKQLAGKLGAAVMWVEPVKSFKELGGLPKPPPDRFADWNRQILRAKMFDVLIYNKDPNLGNWLVDPAWNLILIDHTRAFTTDKRFAHELERVDAELWERFRGLTQERLSRALGAWLGKKEIRAILERRDLLGKRIQTLVAAHGEAAVFMK